MNLQAESKGIIAFGVAAIIGGVALFLMDRWYHGMDA